MSDAKSSNRIHPLVAVAAVAVTLISLTGVAAITGLIPSSNSATPAQIAQQAAPENNPATEGYNNQANQPATMAPASANNGNYAPQNMQQDPHYAQQAPQQEQGQGAQYAGQQQQPAICKSCGHVESVQAVQHAAQSSVGVGTAAGALLGGVLGHQVGHGNGNTLATIAGAVGGGFAGTEVERRARSTTTYEVRVRMENGQLRTFPQSSQQWQAGDAVRVEHGHLVGRS
ncbi:outer membrane lipoprotein [Glaciimonas soli]|uniref:Glycine zipper 2TM domain-containing protein n=1 Tax=Glaciimonas soli TaxID=2590999 RepID=A0A843YUB8_9BURK|nr:glycine zipper 2TM domain-containing protein [Glaciimonas soli]MQR01213.1 glycine zipper 2TM domain-containing protein [Glaciimonas soli]